MNIAEIFNIQNLNLTLGNFFSIVRNWWWIILPFLFLKPFLFLWLWWRQEEWKKKVKEILLEIKLPEEILKPIRAMEGVLNSLWQIYDPINWKEKWFIGKKQLDFSLEITSIGGIPHFYIRTPAYLKNFVESSIYAQYPEVEISEVEDYTKNIPQNIPTKEWDMFGCDMMPLKDEVYPFRTYKEFETERETKEEKRIDPMANLLESLGHLKSGEQLWIQMIIKPVTALRTGLIKRAEKIVQKLMGKSAPPSLESFLPYAIKGASQVLIAGKPLEEKELEPEKIDFGALRLSPGEIEIIKAIQGKVAKYGFETNIRFIYLGRKEVFFKPNVKLPLGFFNEFNTQNLNAMKPWGKTKTKIQLILVKRRVYLRKRKILRNYIKRRSPLDPRKGGTFFLNTEELASFYHFPSRIVAPAPSVPRIPAKRGEAPSALPTE